MIERPQKKKLTRLEVAKGFAHEVDYAPLLECLRVPGVTSREEQSVKDSGATFGRCKSVHSGSQDYLVTHKAQWSSESGGLPLP